jgi:AcrR family transcriptional regulator
MQQDGIMQKIVDHAGRRTEIVNALLTVAARDGHERVSSRAVARELGVATGSLWHYFRDFDEVLQEGAVEVTRQTLTRIDTAVTGLRGLSRLRAIMHQVLPLEDTTRREARVVVGFWGRLAARKPDAEAPTRVAWRDRLELAVSQAVTDGELVESTPQDALVSLLHSMSYGQQVMHVIESVSAEVHMFTVNACIDPWRT